MSIFSRYVFWQTTAALLLILFSLAGIVWIALALRELNVVTSDRQDTMVLLKMTTLALPNLLVMIAPFALLISVVHVLNRLSTDSELIVHTAGGGTVWSLAKPLLALAVMVSRRNAVCQPRRHAMEFENAAPDRHSGALRFTHSSHSTRPFFKSQPKASPSTSAIAL